MRPPFRIEGERGPIVATAIHAGTDLRPEIDDVLILDRNVKRREEDPLTDRLVSVGDLRIVVDRSRFEVDVNRRRESAVYREPGDAWGLDLWSGILDEAVVERSLDIYDEFYAAVAAELDPLSARGPFVVFDLHSYNHRRDGVGRPPAPAAENPEVNVGTGSLDRARFGPVVDAFMEAFRGETVAGSTPDVRENVRFRGGAFADWCHARYPGRACALSIEFKKTFMDEWTDEPDLGHLDDLASALRTSRRAVESALEALP